MRPIHVSVIAGLSLATLGTVQAGIEGELSGTVHVGVNSEYIFRGVDQGGGVMGEAGLSWGGLSLWGFEYHSSLWYASVGNDSSSGNRGFALDRPGIPGDVFEVGKSGRGSFDELDYQSGFSRDFGFMTFEVGQILYSYTGGVDLAYKSAQEVYFTASRQFWETDFAFTYFWDVDEDNDGYSELTIDRSFVLSECLQLALGGTASYDWETSDMHHYGLSAALNWEFNDVLTISPYVSATWAQDGADNVLNQGRDFLDGEILGVDYSSRRHQGDELFGGIVVSASF
jgi:hypothetical protein